MNLMEWIFLRAVDYSNCSNNLRKWEKNQRSFAPTCKTFLICVTHGLRDCFVSRKSFALISCFQFADNFYSRPNLDNLLFTPSHFFVMMSSSMENDNKTLELIRFYSDQKKLKERTRWQHAFFYEHLSL